MSESEKRVKFKRKLVPAALHSELTEYSSLLRALRTNDALDITSQLARYYVQKGKGKGRTVEVYEDDEDGLEGPYEDNNDYQELASDPPLSSQPKAGPSEGRGIASSPSRENWTRWPLLVEDVPAPEWTLDDEIAHLTSSLLRDDSDSECDSDSDTTPALIPSLALSSSHYLDGVFASLAAILPKRPPSMVNRLAPVGWETVLAATEMQGYASTKVLERVQRRLESLYPSKSPAPTQDAETSSPRDTTPMLATSSTAQASTPTPASRPTSVSLSAHRVQILHDSSHKLSSAFSSHRASPADLISLDLGYPGIGFFLPEGWVEDWYVSRAKQREQLEKKKRKEMRRKHKEERKEKNRAKREVKEALGIVTLTRKGGKRKKSEQTETLEEGGNGEAGSDIDRDGGDGDEVKVIGKRKRVEFSLGEGGEDQVTEATRSLNGAEVKPKSRKKAKFKSPKYIVDSD